MKNFEKYEKELKCIGLRFTVNDNGKIISCVDKYKYCDVCKFNQNNNTCGLLRMNWLYEEYKEPPILTDKEKEYLEGVLRPFKDKIKCISKYNAITEDQYLIFYVNNDNYIVFPNFKNGTMYQGMELCKEYTLEELGLFEEKDND